MGIKSLSKFLKDKFPELFEYIHISEYAYKRIAIDISLYVFTYKRAFTPPKTVDSHTLISTDSSWLGAFIKLIAVLRENEVHCVFVFDGKATSDKDLEKQKRQSSHDKLKDKFHDLVDALDVYYASGEISQVLIDFQNKKKIPTARFLGPSNSVNIKAIEANVEQLKKQLVKITQADFALTKKLFDILDVPYFEAPVEAETTCADLCKRGIVEAVLSEDTDVLAYGAPVFLTKINTTEQAFMRIRYDHVLEKFGLTESQFLDFCIMCGTDYNDNIYRVGPNKAYSLIQEHKSIEGIRDNTKYDITVLKHNRVRELFTRYQKVEWDIPYCGQPDFNKLVELIEQKRLRIDIDSLQKSFMHNTVIIAED